MSLINTILVAVDFRESTADIIKNAVKFAKKSNAQICLVHTLPKEAKGEQLQLLLEKDAMEQMSAINTQLRNQDVKTGEAYIRYGNSSDEIVNLAESIEANLILIGSGEKLDNDAVLLGTTAAKIIRTSSKPVLVLKKGQELDVNQILCPVDFSEESSHALKNAIAFAKIFDAKLCVITVYSEFKQLIETIDNKAVNEKRKADKIDELSAFMEKHNMMDVSYSTEVVGGSPAEQILAAIERHAIDLLFMGTTGKSGLSRLLLGSVAEKVTREVQCSFITSRKETLLAFNLKLREFRQNFSDAEKFREQGYYDTAIRIYQQCLSLNFVHRPSIEGILKAYTALKNEAKVAEYEKMLQAIEE